MDEGLPPPCGAISSLLLLGNLAALDWDPGHRPGCNQDGRADEEILVASGWKELPHGGIVWIGRWRSGARPAPASPRRWPFGLAREAIAYVAFAGWDAAGSKWFGYTTYWANRTMSREEGLSAAPDGTGRELTGLAAFLRAGVPGTSKGGPISR